jgi:hypothetical protein
MKRLLAFLLALAAVQASAAESFIVRLSDPPGDDIGDGTLVYPKDADFSRGSFDLRSIEISRDAQGFWFVATFGDFVRELWWAPEGAEGGSGRGSGRGKNHRLPFGFNLDIYIDLDRKPESGQMFSLPGRKVRIDRRYAWERAVILSPQPTIVRERLLTKLRANFPGRPAGEAEAAIDRTIFFPVKRTIFDKSIRFLVPHEFLGDTDGKNWAITAFVTMAAPIGDDDNLGVRQPQAEPTPDTLSYLDSEHVPSPVVDLLLTTAELQYKRLAAGRPLVGNAWGAGAVDEAEIEDSVDTVAMQLKELKGLLDQRLIDEADYRARRDKVLGGL